MFQLMLKSEHLPPVVVDMTVCENNILCRSSFDFKEVYYDMPYEIELHGIEGQLKCIDIYINESKIDCILQENNRIIINDNFNSGMDKKKIFMDCFGFARITVDVVYEDNEHQILYSEYLSILCKKGYMSNKMESMYDYIFKNKRTLLYKPEENIVSSSMNSWERKDSLFSKLNLANEIASFYENNFGYFKTNSRFKVTEKYEVDNIEKLKYMTPKTLEYMVTHPENLNRITGPNGIKIKNEYYYPSKTLVPQYDITVDTYENRIIVGFISSIISNLEEIKLKLDEIVKGIPICQSYENEYIHSAFSILKNTEDIFKEKKKMCDEIISRFRILYNMYNNAIYVKAEEINTPPKPTAIFLSVPKYNMIFKSICKWFEYGEFDTAEDSFMLSVVNLSSIYELFVLCKMINDIKNEGYELTKSEKYTYKVPDNYLFTNSECQNTFYFKKDDSEGLVLYYQPVISTKSNSNDKTGLYRNKTISFSGNIHGECFYTPDYVLKRVKDGKSTYSIIDAKFRDRNKAIRTLPELSYKYLFSLSPIEKEDVINGLCIIYGKPSNDEHEMSLHNREDINNKVIPKSMLIPVDENNTSENIIKYIL